MAHIVFIITFIIWLTVELRLFLRDRKIKALGGNPGGQALYYHLSAAVVICIALHLVDLPFWRFSATAGLLTGTVIIWAGLLLRWWAIKTLGKYFRIVITVLDNQRVINKGPYRYIRHPSYLGSLLILFGVGLGFGNWIGVVIVLILPFIAFNLRINTEEQIMISLFGHEYLFYMNRTRKLIPFLY